MEASTVLLAANTVAQALEIMWKGMLSIFVVIAILTLLVYLITKFVKDPEEKEKTTSEIKEETEQTIPKWMVSRNRK